LQGWVLCWCVKYKNSFLFEFAGRIQREKIARKREHFGLSYVDKLRVIKERETICMESWWDSLKIKQAIVTAPRNVSI